MYLCPTDLDYLTRAAAQVPAPERRDFIKDAFIDVLAADQLWNITGRAHPDLGNGTMAVYLSTASMAPPVEGSEQADILLAIAASYRAAVAGVYDKAAEAVANRVLDGLEAA